MWQRAISLLNGPSYNGPAFHGGDDFVKRRLVGSRQNGAMGAPLSLEGQRAGVCRVQEGAGGRREEKGNRTPRRCVYQDLPGSAGPLYGVSAFCMSPAGASGGRGEGGGQSG